MGSRRDRPRRPQLGIGRVGGGILGSVARVLRQHPSDDHAHLSPGREGTGRERPGRAPVLEPWPYDRGGETDPGGLRCPCAIAPGGCGRGPPRGTPPERHARSRRGGVGCRLGLPRRTPSHTPLGKSVVSTFAERGSNSAEQKSAHSEDRIPQSGTQSRGARSVMIERGRKDHK